MKAYVQTTSLFHISSDTKRLLSYEPIDDIGVWLHKPDAEIEVIVTVTDLRLWYNNFVIKSGFHYWAEYAANPWEELRWRCMWWGPLSAKLEAIFLWRVHEMQM